MKISVETIEEKYVLMTPGSQKLAAEAMQVFPSGITHDSRFQRPYGLYIDRAKGTRKWDVDGNEYIDYFGGHGSHILGHGNAAVVEAVQQAILRGAMQRDQFVRNAMLLHLLDQRDRTGCIDLDRPIHPSVPYIEGRMRCHFNLDQGADESTAAFGDRNAESEAPLTYFEK